MLKAMDKIGKVIIEACSTGLIVGGAVLIYERIFINGAIIGDILYKSREGKKARKAVKANG